MAHFVGHVLVDFTRFFHCVVQLSSLGQVKTWGGVAAMHLPHTELDDCADVQHQTCLDILVKRWLLRSIERLGLSIGTFPPVSAPKRIVEPQRQRDLQ